MRGRFLTALSLALMVSACTVDSGNTSGNGAAETNDLAPAPSNGAPNEPSPPGQPANGAAPGEPSGPVTLSAAPAQVAQGATMTLTLTNGSSEQIGYNLCTSDLQTAAGRPVPTGLVCTMELRTLEPGGDVDYRYELPVNMVSGSYRFLTQVEWMQSGRRSALRSNSFEVR